MLVVGTAAANSQAIPPVNDSHDPYEVYGGCASNFSGFFSKTGQIVGAVGALRNVTAIDVLECTEFNGGGGGIIVPCPPNSPYAYCISTENDGLANHISVGVMKLTKENDPLLSYGGCAPGAGFRQKRALLFEAGHPLWNVDNVVIIDCHAADGAGGTHQVSCPAGRNPYAYCLQSHHDGVGNSVLVGVVNSYSAGDPYAVYGNCYTDTDYRNKASLVTEAGKSLDEVVAINILGCGPSFGAPQQVPQVVSCKDFSSFPATYSYCLHSNSDGKGNALTLGVITNVGGGGSENNADLFLRVTPSATTVKQGDLLTYAVPVWNVGPANAVHEVLNTQVPAGTTFDYIRISGTPGLGTCTHPPYQGTGQIVCHQNSSMAPNTTWTVRLTVRVTAPSGTVITESAATMADSPDPNLANNTAMLSITVQ